MASIVSLDEAVAEHVHDGDTVALEGFTHLIPHAAGHEIIRQGRRDLHLVRMTPDVVYDQLIGAGCATKLIFSWGGNPGVGSLHRFRDAVENGWPHPLEIEEHSHAGMAARYAAGASGLPFGVLRGYVGTDLVDHTPTIAPIDVPVHGRDAHRGAGASTPTSPSSTPSRPTARATCRSGVSSACRRRRCSRRARSIVTVEEIVDELDAVARTPSCCRRGWSTRCARCRAAPIPSFAMGYSVRDNAFYQAWDDDLARPRRVHGVDRQARAWAPPTSPSTAAALGISPRSDRV